METNTYIVHTLQECLESCSAMAEREHCVQLKSVILNVLKEISQPMQLAIIGKISSSKSTLVNAILGEEDVVATDGMEMTFNVSWLKYGSGNADVKVVYKNGKTDSVPRTEWKRWANRHDTGNREDIKYLEITYPHELLKYINIIDTPGLNSTHSIDSRNTVDFLKDVKPDAVLLMSPDATFAQSVIDVLKEFQGQCINNDYTLSPLNAIGAFAKIDTHWNTAKGKSAIETVTPIIESCRKEVQIKSTLFSILPICSTLAMACSTLNEEDITLLESLGKECELEEMLESDRDFCDKDFETAITLDQRKHLLRKFGLYGIYELITAIKQGVTEVTALRFLLRDISGFGEFLYMLNYHFGERATLIKAQNAVKHIVAKCKEIQNQPDCKEEIVSCCNAVEQKILSTVLGLHEYKEIDQLAKIYSEDSSNLDQIAVEEFKRIAGEYGGSLMERLNQDIKTPIDQMLVFAENRLSYWRKLYVISKVRKPLNAELYNVISESYKILVRRVTAMIEELHVAERKLIQIKQYIYGNKYE